LYHRRRRHPNPYLGRGNPMQTCHGCWHTLSSQNAKCMCARPCTMQPVRQLDWSQPDQADSSPPAHPSFFLSDHSTTSWRLHGSPVAWEASNPNRSLRQTQSSKEHMDISVDALGSVQDDITGHSVLAKSSALPSLAAAHGCSWATPRPSAFSSPPSVSSLQSPVSGPQLPRPWPGHISYLQWLALSLSQRLSCWLVPSSVAKTGTSAPSTANPRLSAAYRQFLSLPTSKSLHSTSQNHPPTLWFL
jgi:hypothetical protein